MPAQFNEFLALVFAALYLFQLERLYSLSGDIREIKGTLNMLLNGKVNDND